MKKNRIVIIDSGINRDFSIFNSSRFSIYNTTDSESNIDEVGHGTASCAEMLHFCIYGDFIIIKIFDIEEQCTLRRLIMALEYCLCLDDICLINLSISTKVDDKEMESYLITLIDKLIEKNIFVVAAKSNYSVDSYFSCLPNVLGVEFKPKFFEKKEYYLFDSNDFNCTFFGPIRLIPSNKKYMFYKGNSAATAKLSGYIIKNARMKLEEFDLKRFLLHNQGVDISGDNNEHEIYNNEIIDDLTEKIRWNYDLIRKKCKNNILSQNDCILILGHIENSIHYKIEYSNFTTYDFSDFNNLLCKIRNSILL